MSIAADAIILQRLMIRGIATDAEEHSSTKSDGWGRFRL